MFRMAFFLVGIWSPVIMTAPVFQHVNFESADLSTAAPAEPATKMPSDGLGSSGAPEKQGARVGPAPTDLQGTAGGAGPATAEALKNRPAEEQRIHEELTKWDHKIADLKGELKSNSAPPGLRKSVQLLEHMQSEAARDLRELKRVQNQKVWLDVKSRLDARFGKMTKEWGRIMPKEKTT